MVDRRAVLVCVLRAITSAGLAVALPGMTLAMDIEAAMPTPLVPDAFRKRAAELGYDLEGLWATFHRLKSSYESRDISALWAISAVPLLLIDEGRRIDIHTLNELERLKQSVFSDKARGIVIKCQFPSLFLNSEGAMIGNGEVWIKDACIEATCTRSKFVIATIDIFKD
jgi:hypothetical protein